LRGLFVARLSRIESQERTRGRLLAAARELFGRDGYGTTSVERIAEAAGFSKGAVYANFESKEAIFLTVLDLQGQEPLDDLLAAIDIIVDTQALIEVLAGWADDRSRGGNWALTVAEHARVAPAGSASLVRQEEIIRGHWRQLGERLLEHCPGIAEDAEPLGALLHEIAYGPARTFVSGPSAGDLMRLAMRCLMKAR
jgi:TetR/AcrR family transcriptional regulator, transcriptional repressor of aconitase